MAGYVGQLNTGDVLDPGPYLDGPWRSFERRLVEPGAPTDIIADDAEHAIIVMSGTGSVTINNDSDLDLTQGSSVTVGLGGEVRIDAATPIELFIASVRP